MDAHNGFLLKWNKKLLFAVIPSERFLAGRKMKIIQSLDGKEPVELHQSDLSIRDKGSSCLSHFGEHITIDGYGGRSQLLDNRQLVLAILEELPLNLDMKLLSKPEIYRAYGNNIKDPGGWTGFVVIEESHISIHTFPSIGFVSIDVYTCQNGLDSVYIVSFFVEKFDLQETEINFIVRGRKFGRLALGASNV